MKRLVSSFLVGLLALSTISRAAEISLVEDQGIYKIPVRINDVLTLDFVIDSGASEVQVPADVALTLLRTGTISQEDFLPGKTYVLADGSRVKSERFILKHLNVGNVRVTQVEAGITGIDGQLLLGQSFLQKLDSWSLDNRRRVLVLNRTGSPLPERNLNARKTDAGNAHQPDHDRLQANKGWKSDWGSGILAIVAYTPCPSIDLKSQGYLYSLDVSIPASRVKKMSEVWKVSGGRATTVQGCWYPRDGDYVHAKMHRKKDGRTWEDDMNLGDGKWIRLR